MAVWPTIVLMGKGGPTKLVDSDAPLAAVRAGAPTTNQSGASRI